MICDQRDVLGWQPFCGAEFDPVWQSSRCPHPRHDAPVPTPAQQHRAAWRAGWRPPHARAEPTNTERLVEVLAELLGHSVDELRSVSKRPEVTEARLVTMAVCRERLGSPYSQIGRALCRDHTTVTSGIARVDRVDRLRAHKQALLECLAVREAP